MTNKNIVEKFIQNGVELEVPTPKVYVIDESMVTVSTTKTYWVAPYNTSYYYTNIVVNENAWIQWEEWAIYVFLIDTEMVVASSYRNIRIKIWSNRTYIPLMSAWNAILAGSSYFTKSRMDLYVYKTIHQSWWALHLNNDTSYSAMSVAEWQTGTNTNARTVRADYLKQIIEYHAGNLHDNTKQDTLTAGEWITIDENNVISAEWWGGADTNTINALIDVKLKDSDPVFQITSGLYKILNDMDSTDSCGLTEGDSRAEIVANETSMNLISHSWNIMSKVVSSDTAMSGIVGSSTAKTQMLQSWKAMELIMNSPLAVEYFSDTTILSSVLSSAVGLDALRDSDIAIEVLSWKTLTQSLWNSIMWDSIIWPKVANNNDLLDSISKNQSALKWLISNSTAWGIVIADYEKINICMKNNGSIVIANDTASHLNEDNSLRAIINNNLLDSYIAKWEDTANNIIVFDIDSTSATSFWISRYAQNGTTSTWKISVDWWAWDSQSVATSSAALSVNLWSTGHHTVAIKPATLAYGWARQMWNRNNTNYWTNSWLTFSIKNLPTFAFMTSANAITNYFLYYAFANCTTLKSVNFSGTTTLTSAGWYFMYYAFSWCSNLEQVTGTIFKSNMTTIGTYFMGYAFYNCAKLKKMNSWLTLANITTTNNYMMYYTWYGCSVLSWLPSWFQLPSVYTASWYCQWMCYNCTAMSSSSPSENLTFKYTASNCFYGTQISTTSPSTWTSIAVHRT